MPTIKSVAKLAGVSVSTVSRVLNSSGYVSAKTRKLVMDAVAKLDFRPNHVARSLVHRESKTLGLIVPDIANPYFPALARSVEDAASAAGYVVILCNSGNMEESETRYLSWLRQRMVDGVLLASTNQVTPERLGQDWPVVLLDRDLEGLNVDSVRVNNFLGAQEAVLHLVALGHRKIAHLAGPENVTTAKERVAGFRAALALAGINPDDQQVIHGPFSYEFGQAGMAQLLSAGEVPTAVFCANDMIALGALKTCRERGVNVPLEVSICGFDDIFLAEHTDPPLTTVRQPIYEMGQAAVQMLLSRIKERSQKTPSGKPAPYRGETILLEPQLVIRSTCSRPAN
ncbi:MAG: LacI family DNA-binding transcriptional regulator [Firmicutes bacterium]|nr:LacI family DNA-binding transcriptional regulator [Bacillota bacterium]